MEEEKKNKDMTPQEKLELEISAINLLQQIGVSFNVPLRKEEIATLRAKNSLFNKLLRRTSKMALPPDLDIKTATIPNPNNPEEEIEYYEGIVSIRPLYLETIDAIRAKRLELDIKDPQFGEHLKIDDVNDTYLLKYTKEICEVLSIATINSADTRKHRREIELWSNFYRTHLTNQRYLKLTGVIMMMMDVQSFRNSTRLILGLGTTAPREANRVEKTQSKD